MEQVKSRKSIFELERRVNLQEEYGNIIEYLQKNRVCDGLFSGTLYSILDHSVRTWRYRGTAFSIETYLKQIDVRRPEQVLPFEEDVRDDEVLCVFELLLNLIKHSFSFMELLNFDMFFAQVSSQDNMYDEGSYLFHLKFVLGNIIYILEKINMKAVVTDDKIIIIKRNPDVDSVLEMAPSLSNNLLGYLDFRNAHDIEYKRRVLKEIADYLEPKRKSYNGSTYKNLADCLFFAYNKFFIRHNNTDQISFNSETDLEKMYDKIFTASLHLIRGEKVGDIINEINLYKNK